ncbi:hypothetical protein QGN29_02725 [Temperatibacter marinus]|uniref:Tetratricopeptide repeat protein n=1 Tax=Temperatibacter marinus TaxID=1456591 RepID=A0AA52EIR4_9PROT|nr:hypothetical protein [Temperatibacter marinus]WND03282.1 hypothetical protein QGN29_02725 [Temperatibacter marinus]
MKKKLLIGFSILTLCLISIFTYREYKSYQCTNLMTSAKLQSEQGYYSDVVKLSTLYFSNSACRGKDDPKMIELLAEARMSVVLPANTHLPAQLMMMRMGVSLKNNDYQTLEIAKANFLAEKWATARRMSLPIHSPEAAKIVIASSLKLKDYETVDTYINQYLQVEKSPYARALLVTLINRVEEQFDINKQFIPKEEYLSLAALLFQGQLSQKNYQQLKSHAQKMSEDDLLSYSSIALFNRLPKAAITLLRQPDRYLTQDLILRLGKLLWQEGYYEELSTQFLTYKYTGFPRSDYSLLICLSQLHFHGNCKIKYDEQDYARREGVFLSSRYATLFSALRVKNMKEILDGFSKMNSLRVGLSIIDYIEGCLYLDINEKKQASYFFKASLKLKKKLPACRSFGYDNKLGKIISHIYESKHVSYDDIQYLKKNSPDNAYGRRLHAANQIVGYQEENSQAKVMKLLRPIIQKTPQHPAAQQMMASAYTYFQDEKNALLSLIQAVEAKPELIAQVSRLALGFYEQNKIKSKTLVNWWHALAHQEFKQRKGLSFDQKQALIRDRLYILAMHSRKKIDTALYIATYEKLVEIEPKNDIALNNLAYALFKADQNLGHALSLADRAIESNPRVKEYVNTKLDILDTILKRNINP